MTNADTVTDREQKLEQVLRDLADWADRTTDLSGNTVTPVELIELIVEAWELTGVADDRLGVGTDPSWP